MCWCSIFSLDIWNYIKNKNVDKKFRLVTSMHHNGPLRQVTYIAQTLVVVGEGIWLVIGYEVVGS